MPLPGDGNYALITLTGPDRVGKATQARLLEETLFSAHTLSFPNYQLWSGQVIQAILREQGFVVQQFDGGERTTHFQAKQPQIFQCLQTINRLQMQEEIRGMLRMGHVVCDRYNIETPIYGLADGVDLDFLLALDRQVMPSDLTLVFTGGPFPREGEAPDLNERDLELQARVDDAYLAWAVLFPDRIRVVDVGEFTAPTPAVAAIRVHQEVRRLVTEFLDAHGFENRWNDREKDELLHVARYPR